MPTTRSRRRIAVVTGSRAEFGLLLPVLRAVDAHKRLELRVIAAGSHFLAPARTIREVEASFPVAARVRMQQTGHRTRFDDARATARGIEGFSRAYAKLKPDWVVVLGDRVEAFAAAAAAAIAGIAVAHIHGGDRAEGIADESMRHAITKMAHLHLAATKQSATRIVKMGERPESVHVVGSPAIDGLAGIKPMSDAQARKLGDPRVIMLLHPSGFVPGTGRFKAAKKDPEGIFATLTYMGACCLADEPPLGPCRNVGLTDSGGNGPRGIFLEPNHDAGHAAIRETWTRVSRYNGWPVVPHLPREQFIALLKRMARNRRGLVLGNSSAGLIECSALGVPVVNVGPRQNGRERDRNVVGADPFDILAFPGKMRRADRLAGKLRPSKRFGDGRTGPRIARLLAATDPHDPALLRKRNTY
jgi:UDP-N-acetylglucosamine 2-epimerase